MHKFATLLPAALAIALGSCVHPARVTRPSQSVRVSNLWADSASATYGSQRNQARYGSAKLRPVANTRQSQIALERARRAERRMERRAATASRNEPAQSRWAEMPRAAHFYRTDMEWRWSDAPRQAVVWDSARVEPLPGENGRRMSLPGPSSDSAESWEGGGASPAGRAQPESPGSLLLSSPNDGAPAAARPLEPAREPARQAAPKPPPIPWPEGAQKAPAAKGEAPGKEAAKEQGKSSGEFDHLPFGVPVPGKPGYVNLSGKHSNLPEIDVRGIAPGTPVEVPDPEAPGKNIQFRVP